MNILHILDNDFKSDPRVEKEIDTKLSSFFIKRQKTTN